MQPEPTDRRADAVARCLPAGRRQPTPICQPMVERSRRPATSAVQDPPRQSYPQIFINYRYADEPFGAVLLDFALSARFGPEVIFRSARSIPLGHDFAAATRLALRRAVVLLAVVGRRWATAPHVACRCGAAGPIDWVREEITEAFRSGIRVIPVLLDVDLPPASELPPDLARLTRCQYVRIRHRDAQHDIDRLAHELTKLFPGEAP
jgi:hypothetical protein